MYRQNVNLPVGHRYSVCDIDDTCEHVVAVEWTYAAWRYVFQTRALQFVFFVCVCKQHQKHRLEFSWITVTRKNVEVRYGTW